MKKYSVKLASLLFFFSTAAFGMKVLDSNLRVFVINKAAGSLGTEYDISIKVKPESQRGTISLAYGLSTDVGKLNEIDDILTFGSYGTYFSSPYSNQSQLNAIKQEALNANYKNKDVYLHVVPGTTSFYVKNWHWADSNEQKKPSKLISLITLQDVVKQGSLGQDYAKKVAEICSANYTKAEQSGASNLCSDLKKMFTRGLSEEDAKRVIDGMYARLKMYKTPQGINQIIYVD